MMAYTGRLRPKVVPSQALGTRNQGVGITQNEVSERGLAWN